MTLVLWGSGGAINGVQVNRNSIGSAAQSIQAIVIGKGLQEVQAFINTLSEPAQDLQVINNLISEPAQSLQTILQTINNIDTLQSLQNLLLTIGDISAEFPAEDWNIYLDGRSIKHRVTNASINYSEDTVHNQIEINSIDRELFSNANPAILEGESRIEVHIGFRIMYFLLESRSGDEVRFKLWGRSISARDDAPYADAIDIALDSPTSAETVAESMLTKNVLDWQATDWVLPATFEFSGDPVVGVTEIAQVVGAVVRSQDDGSILVRDKYPVRPVDMPTATPDVDYNRIDNLLALDHSDERGKGNDSIEIYGQAPDVVLPNLELEEESPVVGDTVHVRAYWALETIPSGVTTLVTAGLCSYSGVDEEIKEENIVFRDYKGSTAYPVKEINSITWIGYSGGSVNFTPYSSELTCDAEYAIGTIRYTTRYQRYRIYDHSVIMLLKALILEGTAGISLLVKTGAGVNLAPSITDANITDNNSARARGVAWLDDNKYNKKLLQIRVPYSADANDGAIASIVNANVEVSGNFKIEKSTINFNGPQIVQVLGVVQCQL